MSNQTRFINSSTKSKPVYQKFCKVCQDAGKSLAEFTSHNVRESKDPNARVTCPTLLSQECRFCFKAGHTIKFCNQIKKQEVKDSIARNRPAQEKRPAEKPKAPSNVFQLLSDGEEDGEIIYEKPLAQGLSLPVAPGLQFPVAPGLQFPVAPGLQFLIAQGLPIAPGLSQEISWPSLNEAPEPNARPVLSYKKIIEQVNEQQVNEQQVNEQQVTKTIEPVKKAVEPIVIKRVVLKNGWLDDSDSDEEDEVEEMGAW